MWSEVQFNLKSSIESADSARKFCAYCGLEDAALLGRCYGCQMIYYCSQEHQYLDWMEKHMPKCAELEWASLCQIMESIPIDLSPVYCNLAWSSDRVATWTDWFELRSDLVESVRQLSKTIHQEVFSNKSVILNCREPQLGDILDGILARVTQIMSFPITIGSTLKSLNISPESKPLCIHILYPPQELFDDLVANFVSGQTLDLDFCVKKKFYEILNMFPESGNSIEFVLISTNCYLNTANFDQSANAELIDWSKLVQSPVLKKDFDLLRSKRSVVLSGWQGSYANYIKYACNNSDGFLEPDLVVAFDPTFTKSAHQLITDWTDELKIVLTRNYSCLFTFSDKLELDKAFNLLNAFQTNVVACQPNQFSSLMFRQSDPTQPNNVHSANGYFILLKGFSNRNGSEFKQKTGAEASLNTPTNTINNLLSNQMQTDACIQTMGLSEPQNPSLRHKKGKIQINKSHLTRAATLDIFIESQEIDTVAKQLPGLEFTPGSECVLDYDAKIDCSVHLRATPRKSQENKYYQPRKLIRPEPASPATKPLAKPRHQHESAPQVKPRSASRHPSSITSTESNIKSELEHFSSTSSSSNMSSTCSNRSSSVSSVGAHQPVHGLVSQLRNIFESPQKDKQMVTIAKKVLNKPQDLVPLYENLNFMQSDALVDLGVPSVDGPAPPVPLSGPPQEDEPAVSDTSSCTNYTTKSDFRIMCTERSVTPGSRSVGASHNLLINDIPDSVDEVRLEYAGERHVVVAGYMTSADILRNVLLNNKCTLPVNLKKSEPAESLKQKLAKLSEKEEECLRKKFGQKSRPKAACGIIQLQQEEVIDVDFEFGEVAAKPPRALHQQIDSGAQRKPKCITGSFDPSDFDSFDEDEPHNFIPIEPIGKIVEDALDKHKIELDLQKQEQNLVQFDADDFDSFDDEYTEHDVDSKPVKPLEIQSPGFFRSAFDRLSVKSSRSCSVPMRVPAKTESKATNQKTVNLMNKIQSQVEEKQKLKREKRSKKLDEEKKKLTDQTHRKSLSSLLNFFAPSNNGSSDMVKSDNKRLSLRRLKAKKKAKADNFDCQSDMDSRSNRSLNLDSEGEENFDLKRSLFNQARNSGRIKNEMIDKKQDIKSDLMWQLRAELDEEIKERKQIEKRQQVIESSKFRRSSKNIRSKSVTFLDELSSEDEKNFESSNCLTDLSESRPSLRAGDARMFAGALTGAGPVRSIIKKSVNDIGVIDNLTDQLPKVKLDYLNAESSTVKSMSKSLTTPNFKRKEQIVQSDL